MTLLDVTMAVAARSVQKDMGVVTIEMADQAPVEVRLDNGTDASMCAIAMIENTGGKLQITKLVEYFHHAGAKSTHQLINERFGFGLRFKAGSKD